MTARGSEVVTIHEPAELDDHGDPVDSAPASATARGCVIWPRTSTEDANAGRRFIEGLNVYIPPGEPVPTGDAQVTARGVRYDVDGVPGAYVGKSGAAKGTVVVLARRGAQGGA